MAKRGPQDAGLERDVAPFGAHLRRLREAAGLTQEELASRSDLSTDAVSALERGLRRHPYPHTVRSLADALGLAEEEKAVLLAAVPKRAAPRAPLPESSTLPVPLTPLVGREQARKSLPISSSSPRCDCSRSRDQEASARHVSP